MPLRQVPSTSTSYALIAFDKDGRERSDDPDGVNGRLSERILRDVRQQPPTNVFLFAHGWKGDVPSAIDQYDRWIGAMLRSTADVTAMSSRVPGFRPYFIGLHWPSLPWGDDELGTTGAAFDTDQPQVPLAELRARYLDRLGDTPAIRAALDVILAEARDNPAALTLDTPVVEAYRQLHEALDLEDKGIDAAPGEDHEPFDPELSFQLAQAESQVSFGGIDWGGLLSPLRQLSFWTMKKRARAIGGGGMHQFVKALQNTSPARLHLMGHSFGCIIVSSILHGDGASKLVRPVDSAALIQGALSLWAYCPDIPKAPGTPGYYSAIVASSQVRGPLVTTQSTFDSAVGKFYPLAAGLVGQVDFGPDSADLPKYGALGTFGIRGIARGVESAVMKGVEHEYGFKAGMIYNLESSSAIKDGDGASGAHSDIDGPEVAHVLWQVAQV